MRKLAKLAIVLVALYLYFHSVGLPTLTPDWLVRTAVAIELPGAVLMTSTPAPTPTVTPTAAPTPTPEPVPTPTPTALETVVGGGITLNNTTDYDIQVGQLLSEGPGLTLTKGQPQILIIHTHSSEAYAMDDFDQYIPSDNSRTQDLRYNIIRVGDELTKLLREYGLEVIHDRAIYDYPSYTGSYARAGEAISQYLEKYPTIRLVLDVHRDAIESGDVVYKTVAENEDAPCAQTMFVMGSDASGLEHPNWQENLRLALYLQASVHAVHPTLQRPVKLVKERYNQQLTAGSMILEVGSNGNTLSEALTAIQYFAEGAGPALAKLVE